jgi:hypothetical protein
VKLRGTKDFFALTFGFNIDGKGYQIVRTFEKVDGSWLNSTESNERFPNKTKGEEYFGEDLRPQSGRLENEKIAFSTDDSYYYFKAYKNYLFFFDNEYDTFIIYKKNDDLGFRLITDLREIGLVGHLSAAKANGWRFHNGGVPYGLNFGEPVTVDMTNDLLIFTDQGETPGNVAIIYKYLDGKFKLVDGGIDGKKLKYYCHIEYCLVRGFSGRSSNQLVYVRKEDLGKSFPEFGEEVRFGKILERNLIGGDHHIRVNLGKNIFSVSEHGDNGNPTEVRGSGVYASNSNEAMTALYGISKLGDIRNLNSQLLMGKYYPGQRFEVPPAQGDAVMFANISFDEYNKKVYAQSYWENKVDIGGGEYKINLCESGEIWDCVTPKLHVLDLDMQDNGSHKLSILPKLQSASNINDWNSIALPYGKTSKMLLTNKAVSFGKSGKNIITSDLTREVMYYRLNTRFNEWKEQNYHTAPKPWVVKQKITFDPILKRFNSQSFEYDFNKAEYHNTLGVPYFASVSVHTCKERQYSTESDFDETCNESTSVKTEGVSFKLQKQQDDITQEENGSVKFSTQKDNLGGASSKSYSNSKIVRNDGVLLPDVNGGVGAYWTGPGIVTVGTSNGSYTNFINGRATEVFSNLHYDSELNMISSKVFRKNLVNPGSNDVVQNQLTIDSVIYGKTAWEDDIITAYKSEDLENHTGLEYTTANLNYQFIVRTTETDTEAALGVEAEPKNLASATLALTHNWLGAAMNPKFVFLPYKSYNFIPNKGNRPPQNINYKGGVNLENDNIPKGNNGINWNDWILSKETIEFNSNRQVLSKINYPIQSGELPSYSKTFFGRIKSLPVAQFSGNSHPSLYRYTGAEDDTNKDILGEVSKKDNAWSTSAVSSDVNQIRTGISSYSTVDQYGATTNISLEHYSEDIDGVMIASAWIKTGSANPIVMVELRRGSTDDLANATIIKKWETRVPVKDEAKKPGIWQRYEVVTADLEAELTGDRSGYFLRVWAGKPDVSQYELHVDDFVIYPEYSTFSLSHFDALSQVSAQTNSLHQTISFERDAFGQTIATRDEKGKIYSQGISHMLGEDQRLIEGEVQGGSAQ